MRRIGAICFSTTLLSVLLTGTTAIADKSKLSPETGFDYGDVEDARWAATSGALRAESNGITSIWANPAGLATSQVYHVGALAEVWPEAKRQSYGAGLMDSSSASRVAAGVGFVWSGLDPDGLKREARDLRLALAYPFSPKFSLGLTGRYLHIKQDGLGPLGQSYASGGLDGEAILEGFSFDAGLRIAPSQSFSIGLLGTNLSNPGNGFQPTTAGGGIGFGSRDYFFEADVVGDFTTWQKATVRAMGGAELLLGQSFPLRLGYRFDGGPKTHSISGGAGYIDRSFSAELGVRRSLSGEAHTVFVFTIQFFVESTGLTRGPSASF